jgi:uncharacterized protein
VWRYVVLALPLVLVAAAGLYALYLSLSYAALKLVEWLLDFPPIIQWKLSSGACISNGINVIAVVVVGPIVEEVLFIGFLLNRWWAKYGLVKSDVLSSIVFGVLHVEVLGVHHTFLNIYQNRFFSCADCGSHEQ